MIEIDDKFECPSSIHDALEEIFKMGQNDFQPQQMPSLSVGDVVEWETGAGKYWMVMPTGFKAMTVAEYEFYKMIPRQDRTMTV